MRNTANLGRLEQIAHAALPLIPELPKGFYGYVESYLVPILEEIQKAGGKVIRLTRKPHEDCHPSETALDDYDGFDRVINNEELDIDQTNIELMNVLREWQWLQTKS